MNEKNLTGNLKYEDETLNALLVQFCPIPRDINANILKLETLIHKYKEEDQIDMVLLPEMALTGYIFDNKVDVTPYLEEYNKGLTFDFCASIACRLKCYVFCGYPEKFYNQDENTTLLYNSCMIVDREGKAMQSYRKHFLYEMDKTWCHEGDSFGYLEILSRGGLKVRLGIGICMDLNPCEFKAPWEAFEFSYHCLHKNVDVILFLTNWLDNEPNKHSNKEIFHLFNYWLMRLEPLLDNTNKKKVFFLASDRCGKERDTNFIGCSCAMKIENGEPKLLKYLNKTAEDTILIACNLNLLN